MDTEGRVGEELPVALGCFFGKEKSGIGYVVSDSLGIDEGFHGLGPSDGQEIGNLHGRPLAMGAWRFGSVAIR